MKNRFRSPKTPSISPTSTFSFPSSLSDSMDQTLELVDPIITKWNSETSTFDNTSSLFYENREEAIEFINCVKKLQKSMHLLIIDNPSAKKLVLAQDLMESAMKRLQIEFRQILCKNRAHLDPESLSNRSSTISTCSSISDLGDYESILEVNDLSSLAMEDLRLIAECMISAGYAKECLTIYRTVRKSIVDEGLYTLGVQKMSGLRIQKIEWNSLDLKINNWINAVKIAVNTLFSGERILIDYVFAASDPIRESIFNDISKEAAMILFGFPGVVVKHGKKSPEKVHQMYTAISSNMTEIESIFSSESTSAIRDQVLTSQEKISEYLQTADGGFCLIGNSFG